MVFDDLPAVFTYSDARRSGLSERKLYALRDRGAIEPIGRGLFRRVDAELEADVDLLEIAARAPDATLCLATALARHGLTDLIPAEIDVALPRDRRRPSTQAPVAWHKFDPDTFVIGRDELQLTSSLFIGIYGPERCIIDAFRLRRWEGPELGITALRRWLADPGAQPSALLRMARSFPRVERVLRETLGVLL
jgi:hypothetical protein